MSEQVTELKDSAAELSKVLDGLTMGDVILMCRANNISYTEFMSTVEGVQRLCRIIENMQRGAP